MQGNHTKTWSFQRSFSVPPDCDLSKISTQLKNNRLEITVEKVPLPRNSNNAARPGLFFFVLAVARRDADARPGHARYGGPHAPAARPPIDDRLPMVAASAKRAGTLVSYATHGYARGARRCTSGRVS